MYFYQWQGKDRQDEMTMRHTHMHKHTHAHTHTQTHTHTHTQTHTHTHTHRHTCGQGDQSGLPQSSTIQTRCFLFTLSFTRSLGMALLLLSSHTPTHQLSDCDTEPHTHS